MRYGDGLPLVYGEKDAGKTAVAREVALRLKQDGFTVEIDAAIYEADFAGMLVTVLEAFGCAGGEQLSPNAGDSLSQLRHFSRALHDSKKLGVLIIDNADALDDMSIGALLSLLQGRNPGGFGLHFVFFGVKEMVDRIDALGMLDVAVYDIKIPYMSPSELGEFLRFLLPGSSNVVSPETVSSLWSATKGLPGGAVKYVDETFKNTAPEASLANSETHLNDKKTDEVAGKSRFSWVSQLPVYHLAAVLVLLLILLWVFISPSENSRDNRVSVPIELPVQLQADEVQDQPTDEAAVVVSPPSNNLADESEVQSLLSDENNTTRLNDTTRSNDTTSNRPQNTRDKGSEVVLELDKAETPPLAENTLPANTSERPTPSVQPVALTPPPAAKPYATVANARLRALLGESEAYIQAQEPSFFTLQVLAVSKEEALLSFINQQPNKAQLKTYRAKRNGKDFFVVLAGSYPTKARAQAAVLDLPLRQRQTKPWPRNFESVQSDMQ